MKKMFLICMACAFLATACTTPGKNTAWGAAGGAAVGAITGAIIANNTGGQSHQGAIYGALAGATAGGALGNYYDKQAKELAAIAEVVKSDAGIQVYLKNDILFATNSAELTDASRQTLTDLNRVLKNILKTALWYKAIRIPPAEMPSTFRFPNNALKPCMITYWEPVLKP
ncbi:MAG: hypothetical protein IKA93_01680 [Elusimicrobiaceae bacterium]|nr:hypothetical protein [Elusimicrobiaceae bacterium]